MRGAPGEPIPSTARYAVGNILDWWPNLGYGLDSLLDGLPLKHVASTSFAQSRLVWYLVTKSTIPYSNDSCRRQSGGRFALPTSAQVASRSPRWHGRWSMLLCLPVNPSISNKASVNGTRPSEPRFVARRRNGLEANDSSESTLPCERSA